MGDGVQEERNPPSDLVEIIVPIGQITLAANF
jgi:hypothetical protein